MTDNTNIEAEFSANAASKSENIFLSLDQMVAVAKATKKAYESVPEFAETLKSEQDFVKKIFAGIEKGELSSEMAAEIIAVSLTERDVVAKIDPLTELPNRPAMEEILRNQVALAKRNGTSISVAFVDVDNFKKFNDLYGHDAGDTVLQGLGGHLKSGLNRPTDTAGRWGGEEFVIVLPETDEEGAIHVLNNLRQGMDESVSEAALESGGYKFDQKISASMGVIGTRIDRNDPRATEETVADLVKIADNRMQLAKNNGKNRVVGSLQEKELSRKA